MHLVIFKTINYPFFAVIHGCKGIVLKMSANCLVSDKLCQFEIPTMACIFFNENKNHVFTEKSGLVDCFCFAS